jgi:hypothetical protein
VQLYVEGWYLRGNKLHGVTSQEVLDFIVTDEAWSDGRGEKTA